MTTQATEAATTKVQYRVTNWPEYDRALVRRGRLTIGFDEAFLQDRWRPAPTGKRGAPFQYSDTTIQTLLTLKAVFDLPYRRVEGLAGSIVQLMGVTLSIPDHTLMSRRAKALTVPIPRPSRRGPIDVVVDSTGLKVYSEGEWKVRQQGAGKRRTWRKVHWAVDADIKDVLAVEVTTEPWIDSKVFAGLLEQIADPISYARADGAYDTHGVYAAGERGALNAGSSPHPSAGGPCRARGGGVENGGRLSSPQSGRKCPVSLQTVVR
ncbi:MAG: hypothetical protein QG599_1969 [Pseudomonadota bacterium]|nr:hypothetical protein [Pseudomonadota bacterium]